MGTHGEGTMYALHKVLFLAIMSVALYFNEVESFAVQTMLYNNTEVSTPGIDYCLFCDCLGCCLHACYGPVIVSTPRCGAPHVHATTRSGRGALHVCMQVRTCAWRPALLSRCVCVCVHRDTCCGRPCDVQQPFPQDCAHC